MLCGCGENRFARAHTSTIENTLPQFETRPDTRLQRAMQCSTQNLQATALSLFRSLIRYARSFSYLCLSRCLVACLRTRATCDHALYVCEMYAKLTNQPIGYVDTGIITATLPSKRRSRPVGPVWISDHVWVNGHSKSNNNVLTFSA